MPITTYYYTEISPCIHLRSFSRYGILNHHFDRKGAISKYNGKSLGFVCSLVLNITQRSLHSLRSVEMVYFIHPFRLERNVVERNGEISCILKYQKRRANARPFEQLYNYNLKSKRTIILFW